MATQIRDLTTHITASATADDHPPDIEHILRYLPVPAMAAQAPSGRITSVNHAAESLCRCTDAHPGSIEEYGDYFTGFRPDGSQYAADEWPLARAILHAEMVDDEEIEIRLDTGERRVMLVSAGPVRSRPGVVTQAIGLFRDVTEQRQEQRRREFLMELTDRLRVQTDPVRIMETAAVATGEHLGVSSASYADVDARGRHAIVPAEYRNGRVADPGKYYLEDFGSRLIEHMRRGETAAVEESGSAPLIGADVFDVWGIRSLIAVPILKDDKLMAIFNVMHTAPRPWTRSDIMLVEQVAQRTWHAVEVARAQADLRQSREWLTLALGAGSAAVWDWDLRTGLIHWSEESDAVLGTSSGRRSLKFERWLTLVHPEDRAAAKAVSRRIMAMRDGEVEFEHRMAGGREPRWISMRGRVVTGAHGAPTRVVGIAVDTTDRKAKELEREQLLKQAREASDAKSHFISVISHEFRTPLTAIIGYADLLSSGVSGELAPTQARQLDRVRASAWHLTQLVDQILSFSRIEAGAEQVAPEPTDVAALARDAVSLVGPSAAAKGLGVACELPEGEIILRTDSGKLRQVLLNLLNNAVKFTEKGGVLVRLVRTGSGIEFVVQDTGIGIEPEHMERIFDRFWQANQHESRAISGAGLGLTVSRHIVRLLGGELVAESEVGKGSTFRFELPG
jgi:signal transduction histidine kinase